MLGYHQMDTETHHSSISKKGMIRRFPSKPQFFQPRVCSGTRGLSWSAAIARERRQCHSCIRDCTLPRHREMLGGQPPAVSGMRLGMSCSNYFSAWFPWVATNPHQNAFSQIASWLLWHSVSFCRNYLLYLRTVSYFWQYCFGCVPVPSGISCPATPK